MYLELSISQNPSYDNSIYSVLYINRIKNILEEDGFIKVYFKINERKKIELIKSILLNDLNIPSNYISITEYPYHNWKKEWKDSIKPIYIKNKIIVYPTWLKRRLKKFNEKILIEIVPKMSFGTGLSETTQLMLEMMCDHITIYDKYMLDYGCGTGILSIAGIKLGVKEAIAIDIDMDSIRDANENIQKNRVSNRVKLYQADIDNIKENNFDLIVCNIDTNIISKNLSYIRRKLIGNGKLFITGILIDEKEKINSKLPKNKFEIMDIRSKAEWIATYATRKD